MMDTSQAQAPGRLESRKCAKSVFYGLNGAHKTGQIVRVYGGFEATSWHLPLSAP